MGFQIQGMELFAMGVVFIMFVAVLKGFGILEPMSSFEGLKGTKVMSCSAESDPSDHSRIAARSPSHGSPPSKVVNVGEIGVRLGRLIWEASAAGEW
ncbi:hypothetical protein DPEC_G00121300 [Dallia pectoralis]|uniref:Uncharacterized protein n=1 Tax=Dallia pectoralis TaxID=75939 RepID=A0ACC2GQM9_DALPE|nr:hypothetical protein DPEC_G00121300 [Dallia pectoralis]